MGCYSFLTIIIQYAIRLLHFFKALSNQKQLFNCCLHLVYWKNQEASFLCWTLIYTFYSICTLAKLFGFIKQPHLLHSLFTQTVSDNLFVSDKMEIIARFVQNLVLLLQYSANFCFFTKTVCSDSSNLESLEEIVIF